MKTENGTVLVTVWSCPGESSLVVPGSKEETRDMAVQYVGDEMKEYEGKEEFYTDQQLKELPEWDG